MYIFHPSHSYTKTLRIRTFHVISSIYPKFYVTFIKMREETQEQMAGYPEPEVRREKRRRRRKICESEGQGKNEKGKCSRHERSKTRISTRSRRS